MKSLQKVDSLLAFECNGKLKRVSAMLGQKDLAKNSFES
jgi:hypothetical protein